MRARLKRSPLAQSVGIAFAIQVVGYSVNFVLNVLLARWLGAQQYGEFIFIKNWVTILGIIGTLGFFGAAMKYISAYWSKREVYAARGFVMMTGGITLVLSLVLTLLAYLFLRTFPPQNIQVGVLLPFLSVTILMALHTLFADILRALQYVS